MKIKITAVTDTGKECTNNEDAFIICPDLSQQDWAHNEIQAYIPLDQYGSVCVVADGMGGANAGEVASSIAVMSVKSSFSKVKIEKALLEKNIDGFLYECIKKADAAINERIWDDPNTSGMGTTIVLCWIIGQNAHIAWCGDSRCYVFNPYMGLKQLTKDHSYVQELVDKCEITENEAFMHPENNVITRGLGDVDLQSTPDMLTYLIRTNDVILLCTDGLCGYCTNRQIEKVLSLNYIDIKRCRGELLKCALDAGGQDNICIVLASLINNEQSAPVTLSFWEKVVTSLKSFL